MSNRRVGHALLFLAAAVGILLAAVPAARADSEVRIVRLSYVTGDVQMDRGTGQGFERAVMNMPVTSGSRIWTGDDGYAEVEFEDGSTGRLAPDTEVNVQELSLRGDGGRVSMLELQQGIAYFDVRASEADQFRVTIRGYDLQVPSRAHFRVIADQNMARVAVFDGTVVVPSGEGRIEVAKNQTLNLDLANPQYEVIGSVSQEPYDQWDSDRAEYRANYQAPAADSGAYSAQYSADYAADYSYGLSDMNYYGSYSYVSGWGWMWQPYFVGAGWNPWMDGAWVWYPGLGYVWVSAYPWGWMPYRYGDWFFISGHGWCWRPGRRWSHWDPVTPVHNPPPNFHPPHVPVSGGPHVVPVGHGPSTLYPDPNGGDWHGPRRPVDPGAPGIPVRVSLKTPEHPVPPDLRRPLGSGEEGSVPASGPVHQAPPTATPTVGAGGSFKGGQPIPPAPIPPRSAPDEHVAVPSGGTPPASVGSGTGSYKPVP
ncbi:MAG TPA: FecR family protein, partial [Terriglobales bacterium]|nr:FecR family protein [Terriglobales bacterium]